MPAKGRSSKPSKTTTRKVSKKVAKKATKKVAKKAAKKVAKKAAKKVAKKAAKKARRQPPRSRQQEAALSADSRHKMIQIAAYYRAERCNFQNGDPVADWLSGEKEVDKMLSGD